MISPSSPAVLPLALVAGTVVLTVAACGGSAAQIPSSTSPAGATTSAAAVNTPSGSTTSASAGATASATTSSSSSPASGSGTGGSRCAVGALRIRFANDFGGAGAGNVAGALTFKNTSSTPCTLAGFPGVSFVRGSRGTQVGAAATRTDAAVKTRTLAPGTSVKATLRRTQPGNYGDDCQRASVDGFRVYPPDSTESAFVAFKTTGCKSLAAPLLQVGPVG